MTSYDTILVPTDGSDHATRAAEVGATVARRFDASIHVLSVVDVYDAGGPFSVGGLEDAVVDRLASRAEDAIEEVKRAIDAPETLETAVRKGTPRDEILAYAGERGVDLIAMGTQGRTGIDRYVAGSVAEGVLRHADVPVLTTRVGDERDPGDTVADVLVPTDGSECAEAAVDHAVEIASRFGARIHALHVVNVGSVAATPRFTPPMTLVENLESQGEKATERIASRAQAAGLESTTRVTKGYPAMDILEYADANGTDLIVMGTAGHSGLDRFLLGSTTERVVRQATSPVVAVRTPETRTA